MNGKTVCACPVSSRADDGVDSFGGHGVTTAATLIVAEDLIKRLFSDLDNEYAGYGYRH